MSVLHMSNLSTLIIYNTDQSGGYKIIIINHLNRYVTISEVKACDVFKRGVSSGNYL